MYYPEDALTEQPEKVIVSEIIREKMLELLKDEVPHGIGVEIIKFKDREGKAIVDIDANVYCEKNSHKGIVIGKNGEMLKKIDGMFAICISDFRNDCIFLIRLAARSRNF